MKNQNADRFAHMCSTMAQAYPAHSLQAAMREMFYDFMVMEDIAPDRVNIIEAMDAARASYDRNTYHTEEQTPQKSNVVEFDKYSFRKGHQ